MNSWLTRIVGAGCVFLSLAGVRAQESGVPPNRRAGNSASVKTTPESLDFGTQSVGATTPPKTATLANTGTSSLTITDIVTSGIDFAQTNTCDKTLAAGATCVIQVTFKPAITGPRVATLQILDSDPASPQSVVLSGTGR